MKRPRTKPPDERREELMNSAERLFLKQGVAATPVEQITRGADVAKGTFYLYFSTKEDIIAALRERFAQTLFDGISTAVAREPEGNWRGKLAAWARSSVRGYLSSMELHDMVFYENQAPTHEGLTDNPIIDHLCALLKAGAEAKAWSIDDARFHAVFLFSGLHGVVGGAHGKHKRVSAAWLAQKLERVCFRAVGLAGD
jgi:AcrR family transcriptional regulator